MVLFTAEKLIAKVKRIYYKGESLNQGWLKGVYKSQFKGEGLEFFEVRPWQPGDDVRHVDWNVTARSDKPFVKTFREERELKVCFAVDVSSSMQFGGKKQKTTLAAEIVAAIGLAAVENRDRVGGYLFSDKIEKHYRLESNLKHLMRILRDLLATSAREKGVQTDINFFLKSLIRTKERSLVLFIISDFHANIEQHLLNEVADKNKVIAFDLRDPLEEQLNDLGNISIQDFESLKEGFYSSPQFLQEGDLEKIFRKMQAHYLKIYTDDSYEKKLHQFFG